MSISDLSISISFLGSCCCYCGRHSTNTRSFLERLFQSTLFTFWSTLFRCYSYLYLLDGISLKLELCTSLLFCSVVIFPLGAVSLLLLSSLPLSSSNNSLFLSRVHRLLSLTASGCPSRVLLLRWSCLLVSSSSFRRSRLFVFPSSFRPTSRNGNQITKL